MFFKLVRKRVNNRRKYPPIHISPVESNLLPGEHSQPKDPRLFLQAPLTHGLLSHSFISIIQKQKSLLGLQCASGKYYTVQMLLWTMICQDCLVYLPALPVTFKRHRDRQVACMCTYVGAHILKVLIKWLFSTKIVISNNLDHKVFPHQL